MSTSCSLLLYPWTKKQRPTFRKLGFLLVVVVPGWGVVLVVETVVVVVLEMVETVVAETAVVEKEGPREYVLSY